MCKKKPLCYRLPKFIPSLFFGYAHHRIEEGEFFRKAVKDVFLFSPEKEVMDSVKEISENVLKDTDLHAVFYDVTRIGRRMWISIYFAVSKDYLHVETLGNITNQINAELAEQFDNCVCELVLAKKEDLP